MGAYRSAFVVVGLGASGMAAVRLLRARGLRVVANDLRTEAELGARVRELRDLGADLVLGGHPVELLRGASQIVLSPGVPTGEALEAAEAAGVPILSEIELAAPYLRGTILAVSGTNGKSTVTSLLGEMCRRTGRPTFVGGNLGEPLVNAVHGDAAAPGGFLVVELSSFQLERTSSLRPHVAVLTNVTPDHLDRYASMEDYAGAKARLFARQTADDAAVVPAGDALCARLAATGRGVRHEFGGATGEVCVVGGVLRDVAGRFALPITELGIRGGYNEENACAAALAASLAGISPAAILGALREFRGLRHRMQFVRARAGVEFFDDSKATNVGATVAALSGLRTGEGRVVLIAGGRHKGGSYEPLAESLAARGRAVVLIGEAAELIAAALAPRGVPTERARDMEEAVTSAARLARPGDAVLLAPACSSYDMFTSYVQRGEAFQAAVARLPEGP